MRKKRATRTLRSFSGVSARQQVDDQSRRVLGGAIDAVFRLLEVRLVRLVDVDELLRIPVDQGEPGALDLHHNAVPLTEGMANVRKLPLHIRDFTGRQGLRFFKTVSKL